MRKLWWALSVTGALGGANIAYAGSLILPERTDDPVMLTLQQMAAAGDVSELLRVFVGPPQMCCVNKTPMVGGYTVNGQTVTFRPAFDFIAGQSYTVQSGATAKLTGFTIATQGDQNAPELVAIYPSGPQIPENTLRFYLQFSEPMMPHRVAEFVRLVDAQGRADTAAFMFFSQELWNADRTRLTLLMDPGRIKRGVAQNVALGPALAAGSQYSIVINPGWPTARGDQMLAQAEHGFRVSTALRNLPDVLDWSIEAPARGTLQPLMLTFDRPYDQQLAQNAISVRDAEGHEIPGTITLQDHERRWRFEPVTPWRVAKIQVHVDPNLEDVAGNNFRDLLDHPAGTKVVDPENLTLVVRLAAAPKPCCD